MLPILVWLHFEGGLLIVHCVFESYFIQFLSSKLLLRRIAIANYNYGIIGIPLGEIFERQFLYWGLYL